MNRLTKAWLALTGRLEPEVVEKREIVFGDPNIANLYVVHVPDKNGQRALNMSGKVSWLKRDPRYFSSCEQAHAAHPGEHVNLKQALRIDGRYFIAERLSEVTLEPKPKRPKGKVR